MQVYDRLNDINVFSDNNKSDDEGEISDTNSESKNANRNLKMRTAPGGFGVEKSASKTKSMQEQPAIR